MPATLSALQQQGNGLSVIVIDDQSTDNTAAVVREHPLTRQGAVQLLQTPPLAEGWSGKLWALQQGWAHVRTPLLLLLDADITLHPGMVAQLQHKLASDENLGLVSVMAWLRMKTFWECLLLPAFIFFLQATVPPLHWRIIGAHRWAAAAGGVILLRTEVLQAMGGFEPIHTTLIDDCALARHTKMLHYRTWIGLSHDARSTRACDNLAAIWQMVARTAYSQLHFSPLLLLICSLLMLLAFFSPLLGIFLGLAVANVTAVVSGFITLIIMFACFLPVLRYYNVALRYLTGILVAGMLFLPMTWSSACMHYQGAGAGWKGRHYG